jgi:hypothetical protein
LQATEQLTKDWTLMRMGTDGVPEIPDWLAKNVPEGSAVGIDALVHTIGSARGLETKLTAKGVKLVCVEGNLVDKCAALCSFPVLQLGHDNLVTSLTSLFDRKRAIPSSRDEFVRLLFVQPIFLTE